MRVLRVRFGWHLAVASAFTVSLAARTPTPLSAQRGGMGGRGGGGSRGPERAEERAKFEKQQRDRWR